MGKTRWWGAPTHVGTSVELSGRLDQLLPGETVIENTEPLTIRVRGVNILEDYEWRPGDRNDIMIVSTTQFGSEPPVQRLHFLQKDVEAGWQGDFFNDVILAIRDYNADTRDLTLRIQVYEIDGANSEFIESVNNVSQSVSVAFPLLAPYAAAVSFGVPALLKLIDNINEHDRIIDERLTLEKKEPGKGHKLLQPGYFVCFREPVDEQLSIGSDLRVMKADSGDAFTGCSYTILQLERTYHAHRWWSIDQKAAKLIAELSGKGQSGKAALDFIRDTMSAYDNFRKLERARELKAKQELTGAERAYLEELGNDESLAPFLKGLR